MVDWRRLERQPPSARRTSARREAAPDGGPADGAGAVAHGEPLRRALHVEEVAARQAHDAGVMVNVVQADAADHVVLGVVACLDERELDNLHELAGGVRAPLQRRPGGSLYSQHGGALELALHESRLRLPVHREDAHARLEGLVGQSPVVVPLADEALADGLDLESAVGVRLHVHAQRASHQAPLDVSGDLRHVGLDREAGEDHVQVTRPLRHLQLREDLGLARAAVDRGDRIPGHHRLVRIHLVPHLDQAGLDLQHGEASHLDLDSDSDRPRAVTAHVDPDLLGLGRKGLVHHLRQLRVAADYRSHLGILLVIGTRCCP
mmetsp:Transcript_18920/g.41682  ORF Transcript_18920/g.41682 Transcript_18920/m.41682 type:complete len:320 (-) Transcript_18920:20-979(-)